MTHQILEEHNSLTTAQTTNDTNRVSHNCWNHPTTAY